MIAALFDELLRRMRKFSHNIVGDDEVLQAKRELCQIAGYSPCALVMS